MVLTILSDIFYSGHKMFNTVKKYQLVFYQVCGIIKKIVQGYSGSNNFTKTYKVK